MEIVTNYFYHKCTVQMLLVWIQRNHWNALYSKHASICLYVERIPYFVFFSTHHFCYSAWNTCETQAAAALMGHISSEDWYAFWRQPTQHRPRKANHRWTNSAIYWIWTARATILVTSGVSFWWDYSYYLSVGMDVRYSRPDSANTSLGDMAIDHGPNYKRSVVSIEEHKSPQSQAVDQQQLAATSLPLTAWNK